MTNKKQARSRITALLLAVSLLFSVASIPVFAEASQEAQAPTDPELAIEDNAETESEDDPAENGADDQNAGDDMAEAPDSGGENTDDLPQSPIAPGGGPIPDGVRFAPANDRVVTDDGFTTVVPAISDNLQYLADNGGGRLILNLTSPFTFIVPTSAITISEDVAITLYAPNPLTLRIVNNWRHFTFNINPGRTLTLRMENVTLDGYGFPGGIKTTGAGTLVLESGVIENCHNANTGGAILAEEGNLVINGGLIRNNQTAAGAICVGKGDCTINGGTITGNKTASSGGGIALLNLGATLKITGGVIANNTASTTTGYGGGVFVAGTASDNSRIQISGGEIYGNKAFRGGGVYGDNCQITMTGGTIGSQTTPNEATGIGGGLFAGKLTMTGGEITGNEAKASNSSDTGAGGGVYISESGVIRGNAKITKNRAGRGGGILTATQTNLEISGNAEITGNYTIEDGHSNLCGAGAGIQAEGNVLISGGRIADNEITGNPANIAGIGGGLHFYPGSALGAQTATLKITGGEISGNRATHIGGGVMIEQRDASYTYNIAVSGGTISKNEAASGGGMYIAPLHNDPTLRIHGSALLLGNRADRGGGVYSHANINFSGNSSVSSNTATSGGGVYAEGSVAINGGAKIVGNEAQEGGGIYGLTLVEISGGVISGNTASMDGGGFWATSINNVSVTGGSFTGNLAGNGGYWITSSDESSAPYNVWSGYTSASGPFSHIANNYDGLYTPVGETPVHAAIFTMNDGSGNEFYWTLITSPGPLPDFPGNPSRNGFTFTGWNDRADGTGGGVTKNYQFTTSQQVYAQWRANNPTPTPPPSGGTDSGYTRDDDHQDNRDSHAGGVLADRVFQVEINLNGGSFKGADQIRVKDGDMLAKLNDPIREGYIFTGWYTDKDCTTLYNFNRTVTASFTLYAGWEPVETAKTPPETATVSPYISGYPDGTFRPDTGITRAEAVLLVYNLTNKGELVTGSSVGSSVGFSDVPNNAWHFNAITYLAGTGAVSGYPNGTFMPDNTVTRAEFAAMLARVMGLNGGSASFADIPPDHWASGSIAAMERAGYISGYPNGSFGPGEPMGRAQAVTVLNNVLNRETASSTFSGVSMPFGDVPSDHWAYYEIMAAAVEHSVVSGR